MPLGPKSEKSCLQQKMLIDSGWKMKIAMHINRNKFSYVFQFSMNVRLQPNNSLGEFQQPFHGTSRVHDPSTGTLCFRSKVFIVSLSVPLNKLFNSRAPTKSKLSCTTKRRKTVGWQRERANFPFQAQGKVYFFWVRRKTVKKEELWDNLIYVLQNFDANFPIFYLQWFQNEEGKEESFLFSKRFNDQRKRKRNFL